MKKNQSEIAIGIVCFALFLIVTVQFRTMKKASSAVTQNFTNYELRDELLEWKERYERQTELVERSEKALEKVRNESAEKDEFSKQKAEKLKRDSMLLGLTNVSGPGVIVTAKDGKPIGAGTDLANYLVHDVDLREIISELTNAGAEAISINGERIVANTCIMCAGNIISVNGEKISSPFVINAIGNPETMYGALARPGGYLQFMAENYVPVDIRKGNNIQIKKYNGALSYKYAKDKDSRR